MKVSSTEDEEIDIVPLRFVLKKSAGLGEGSGENCQRSTMLFSLCSTVAASRLSLLQKQT